MSQLPLAHHNFGLFRLFDWLPIIPPSTDVRLLMVE